MKSNFFLLLCMMAFFVSSCGKKGGQTISGHSFEYIEDVEGTNAVEGDYVYFLFSVKVKDSVVFNSITQNPPFIRFKLPKSEKPADKTNSQPVLEVLYFMSKGDSAVVYMETDSVVRAQIGIDDADKLAYHVRLIDIKDEASYQADMKEEQKVLDAKFELNKQRIPEIEAMIKSTLEDFKSGKNKDQLITTASGLKYIVHTTGTGAKAEAGKSVTVNYYGCLMDGTHFDDSWSRPQEFNFVLGNGQVIPGWDEGVALLNEGTKATFFIPYALAYGDAGRPPVIPEKSDLVFYIELNKVN